MALMPVATLRTWEQRYQAVRPTTTASGHRIYGLADVQRVLLLRQLTQQGHAIRSLAPLETEQLQALSGAGAAITQAVRLAPPGPAASLRLVVVGQTLAERVRLPAVAQQAGVSIQVVAVFATLAEAAQAAGAASGQLVDALLWHCPGLQPSARPELDAARNAWAARQVAVVYRFAGAAAKKALSDTGARVWRETPDDQALGTWMASLGARLSPAQRAATPAAVKAIAAGAFPGLGVPAAPRRFDDAALAALAALPSTSACECPRHVAELLMQIASFESYSADCATRYPDDAELHAYLQQVAGITRQLFESAVEAVARHEGLPLR